MVAKIQREHYKIISKMYFFYYLRIFLWVSRRLASLATLVCRRVEIDFHPGDVYEDWPFTWVGNALLSWVVVLLGSSSWWLGLLRAVRHWLAGASRDDTDTPSLRYWEQRGNKISLRDLLHLQPPVWIGLVWLVRSWNHYQPGSGLLRVRRWIQISHYLGGSVFIQWSLSAVLGGKCCLYRAALVTRLLGLISHNWR